MKKILIVEDEARIAALLEKGLRKHGYNTATAEDGNQAIDLAQTSDFDLLLLDLALPGKDGLTVLQELRSHGKLLPVIIVTARDDARANTLAAGADDYVTKPFQFAELLARVQAQLPNS